MELAQEEKRNVRKWRRLFLLPLYGCVRLCYSTQPPRSPFSQNTADYCIYAWWGKLILDQTVKSSCAETLTGRMYSVSLLVCPYLYTDRISKLSVSQINSFHYWSVSLQLMSAGAWHQGEAGVCDHLQHWKINWFWTFHCVCCIFHFIWVFTFHLDMGTYNSLGALDHIKLWSPAVKHICCLWCSSSARKSPMAHAKTVLCVVFWLVPLVPAGKLVIQGWEAPVEKLENKWLFCPARAQCFAICFNFIVRWKTDTSSCFGSAFVTWSWRCQGEGESEAPGVLPGANKFEQD